MTADCLLAIETSCDETAVAICDRSGRILISEVASQVEIHSPYGGVVPELASRNHNLDLTPLIRHTLEKAGVAMSRIGAVAATSGPGLASSLLVGDTTAKALAAGLGKPFVSVNHMEGHLLSPFIETAGGVRANISLVVSGGHTLLVRVRDVGNYEVLGSTKDDAAGEAFDKVGKMLGLPYPGGPEVDRRSETGDPHFHEFPRSMLGSGDYDFSFSGLKTSAYYLLEKLPSPLPEKTVDDVCASFQAAVVEVLVEKLFAAARLFRAELVTVSGGVSCNAGLRRAVAGRSRAEGIPCLIAEPGFSTDNAAMIAYTAAVRLAKGFAPSPLNADIDPNLSLA